MLCGAAVWDFSIRAQNDGSSQTLQQYMQQPRGTFLFAQLSIADETAHETLRTLGNLGVARP